MGEQMVVEPSQGQRSAPDDSPLFERARPRGWATREERSNTLAAYDAEVAGYREQLERLEELDVGAVMLKLSGIAARLATIRADLISSGSDRANQYRTKQLDPLRQDLHYHFECHSRRLSALEFDFKMDGGQV